MVSFGEPLGHVITLCGQILVSSTDDDPSPLPSSLPSPPLPSPCVSIQNVPVCTFKTSLCVPAPRAHVTTQDTTQHNNTTTTPHGERQRQRQRREDGRGETREEKTKEDKTRQDWRRRDKTRLQAKKKEQNTCARGAGIHGDVLNVHTVTFLNPHTGFSTFFSACRNTHKQHEHTHQTHHDHQTTPRPQRHTPHNTTHNITRRQTETEEDRERQRKRDKTRQEKTVQDKKTREDEREDGTRQADKRR